MEKHKREVNQIDDKIIFTPITTATNKKLNFKLVCFLYKDKHKHSENIKTLD